jgi:hypothetical protein
MRYTVAHFPHKDIHFHMLIVNTTNTPHTGKYLIIFDHMDIRYIIWANVKKERSTIHFFYNFETGQCFMVCALSMSDTVREGLEIMQPFIRMISLTQNTRSKNMNEMIWRTRTHTHH